MENDKKPKLDMMKLTPEQRDKLDSYNQNQDKLRTLKDIADILQELLDVADDTRGNTDKLEALGAVLTDAREQLVKLNDKEAPEAPDYAKPIVDALKELQSSLKQPEINVAAPNVTVDAPKIDLTEFNKTLKNEVPKAFEKAIKLIPNVEIPENKDYTGKFDEMLVWLQNIDTASRMKPIPGSMTISNLNQYTEDTPSATNPVGGAVNLIRKDTPAAEVNSDGYNIAQRGTKYGAGYVQIVSSTGSFIDTFVGSSGLTDTQLRATPVPVSGTVTADTELPTASALADATANPTTPSVGIYAHDFNGTTWDRRRHSFVQTTTGITATGNGTAIDMTTDPQKMFAIVAKEQGDTSVFDVRLEGSLDNTNWTELLQITNVTPGDGKLGFAIDKPVLYVRYRVAGITRVTGTLDIKIVATE